MSHNNKEDWPKEFREYFDKTLKPKKPTMANLDRELCINFISKVETQAIERTKREVFDILESFMKKEGGVPLQVADILTSVQTYLLTNKQ